MEQPADLGMQEAAVLTLLTANPFANQQGVADALGLARSTVAAHIVSLTHKGYILGRGYVFPKAQRIFCCGGATIDRKYWADRPIVFGTKNPVRGHRAFGGVARNVAENLVRLGIETSLMTIVGDDENGRSLVRQLDDLGIDTSQTVVSPRGMTAEYAAVLGPDGDLVVGMSDVGIFDTLSVDAVERAWPHAASATWVFAECNLTADVIATFVARKATGRFRLAVDAVSNQKAERLPRDLAGIDILFLNRAEAGAYLAHTGRGAGDSPEAEALALLAAGAGAVVLTAGAEGYLVGYHGGTTRHAAIPATAIDVIGAGDAMIAGTLFRLIGGASLEEATETGALLAAITTQTDAGVLADLSPAVLGAAAAAIPQLAREVTP
jgi:pseudouridine kinase